MRKNIFSAYLAFVVLTLLSSFAVIAQTGTLIKKDTLKFAASGGGPVTSAGGGGYVLVGEANPYAGYTYDYELQDGSGNNVFIADHWTVTCGTVILGAVNGATIQWNSSGCSSGILRAYDASNGLLATSTYTMNPPPALSGGTIENPSQTINYNTTPAVISVSTATGGACGGAYTFTWESSPNGTSFSPISSATLFYYQPPALTSTTYYRRITSCGGVNAYTSNIAVVNVYPQLQAGNVSPASQSINYNTSASTLSISGLSGGNGTYSYQWYSSTTTTGFSVIAGAQSSTYAPGNLTGTMYYQVAVTSNGVAKSSVYGVVNAYPQLIAGSASSSQTINYNTSPAAISATVPSGGNGTYSYKWQSSPNNVSFSDISGAVGSSYAPSNLTATTYYRQAVTSNGVTVYTNAITISVYPQVVAGSIIPSSQSINYNTSASSLSASGVSGGNGAYSYQWYSSASTSGFSIIAGAQSATYSPGNLTATRYYQLAVTSNGVTVNTAYCTVNVYPQLQPGSVTPASQTINYNTSPGVLSSSGVSGGNGGYGYQWQYSPTSNFDATGANVSGAVSATYTPGNLTSPTYYRVLVNSNGVVLPSSAALVNVYGQLQAGVASSSQSVNYNNSPQSLTATAPTGGNGSYTYTWQVSSDNIAYTNISGTGSGAYSPGNLTSDRYYRQAITSNGITVYTNAVRIQVYPALTAGVIAPSTQTISYNTTPGSLHITGTAGGSGFYTYQWQSSADNTNWDNEQGLGDISYAIGQLTATRYFRVIINSNGVAATSGSVVVNVAAALSGGIIAGPVAAINYNTSPGALTSSQAASNGNCSGSYVYQWEKWDNSNGYTPIAGATFLSYTPGNLKKKTYFRRKVSCNGEIAYSNVLTILVNDELMAGLITPDNQILPTGTTSVTLTANPARGGSCGSYLYQWESATTETGTYSPVSGAITLTYTIASPTGTKYYRLQVSCGVDVVYSNVSRLTIGTPVTNLNYIRVRDISKPGVLDLTTAAALTNVAEVKQSTQYFDGLGRLTQTVGRKANTAATDMVQASLYDALGREMVQLLPYASASSDGSYKNNATVEQNSFQNVQNPGEQYYYGQTELEPSSLSRVAKTLPAGISWIGGNRGPANQYWFNTGADSVRIWEVTDVANNFGSYATASIYPAGALYKTIAVDEQGKQVISFTDKQGLAILKKVQIGTATDNGSGSGHASWLCTYYIYDDNDNLRCVIQPQGVRQLNATWAFSGGTLNEHCFRYEYDIRNRMIMKRLPGTASQGEVWMVYDGRDRLVMMQDGNMRLTNKWMITKYDLMNRAVETGLWMNSTSVLTHRTSASASTSYPATPSNYEQLTVVHYDDYTNLPGGLTSTFNTIGSSETITAYNTSPLYAQQQTAVNQLLGMVAWTQTKVLGTASDNVYSVNLYDNKGRIIQSKAKNAAGGEDISSTQYNWLGQPLVTINKTEKAGTNPQTITSVNKLSYDNLARLIRVEKKIGHSGISSGALSANWATVIEQEYDALGQLKRKTIGNKKDPATGVYYTTRQPLQELLYDYNIRGWMLGVNRDYLTTEGQTSDGKLFGFELAYDKLTSKAGYNFLASQLNGNINGLTWKSDGDDKRRRYDFSYDGANRLLTAEFKQNNSGSTWDKTLVDFTVQMGNSGADDGTAYDANGNILKMKQWGLKLTGSTQIDNLTYAYWNAGNMLKAVTESGTGTTDHKLGDFTDKNTSATDYGYDRNGNLAIDLNKRINGTVAPNTGLTSGTGIIYNHLNLPAQITVRTDDGLADKGTISYVYDAGGSKLKKITVENNVSVTYNSTPYTTNITTTTTYLGGAVFESKQYANATVNTGLGYTDRLQFFGQEEGRIRAVNDPANPNTLTGLEYDYMIKDHLGNVRMMLTEELKTDAYPVASMETAQATTEDKFYANLSATRVDKPSGYPTDTYTNPNDKVAKVRGDGNKIGPSMLLKVMAGDKFNIRASAWWTGSSSGSNTSPLTSIVSALISSAPGLSGGKFNPADLTSTILDPQVNAFLANQPAVTGKPKAYLNWILFDEQFKYVQSSSGAEAVDGMGILKPFNKTGMPVDKNGYLYIYVSNETSYDVFFDNLQVTHVRGSLLEESHYYPFGLTMAGISSKTFSYGNPENKKKYQQYELNSDFDINLYESRYRSHDPQIGRFLQIDPKPNDFESPYAAMGNNPMSNSDFLGDTVIAPIFIPQKDFPAVYQNHMNYLAKHPTERIGLFGLTFILFDYESDKKKQDQNRRENKKANPINNKDPKLQEDEVGAASTKQGGARGVRMAVPKEENAAHGGQMGAAIRWLKMKDGDKFLTILIPDKNSASKTEESVNVAGKPATANQASSVPEESRQPINPAPAFRFGLLGAAVQAAINSLTLDPQFSNERSRIN
jgi:RHS repeat-associated protein